MTILLLYTSLIRVTETVNIDAPSFAQYTSALRCPCSKISIDYGKFLRIEYNLHQICSSTFVDRNWIDYLKESITTTLSSDDIRLSSLSTFQALRTFCELINRTISDSLTQFYSNQYVSASVISQQLFESETKSFIDQFRLSMTNSFLLSLAMIRGTTQANVLFSRRQTNYKLFLIDDRYNIDINVFAYMQGSCASPSKVIQPHLHPRFLFDVPGFYTGCYVIESLLQSTLECFYSQQCIDKLQRYLNSSSSINVRALDESLPSVYSVNSTIQKLVDNLMIELWNVSTIYERYYTECQPTQCTYTLQRRNDVIYIFTILFEIAGGLTTALELIMPRLVKIIMYCIRKRTIRVVPQISIIET
jgi:hypothetical protein